MTINILTLPSQGVLTRRPSLPGESARKGPVRRASASGDLVITPGAASIEMVALAGKIVLFCVAYVIVRGVEFGFAMAMPEQNLSTKNSD